MDSKLPSGGATPVLRTNRSISFNGALDASNLFSRFPSYRVILVRDPHARARWTFARAAFC